MKLFRRFIFTFRRLFATKKSRELDADLSVNFNVLEAERKSRNLSREHNRRLYYK